MHDDRVFKFHPSRCHALIWALLLILAIYTTLTLSLAWLPKLSVLAVIIVYGCLIFRRSIFFYHPYAVNALLRLNDGGWVLKTNSGDYQAQLLGDSILTQWVSVLQFRSETIVRRFTIVLFRDSMPPFTYRKLMQVLRMF